MAKPRNQSAGDEKREKLDPRVEQFLRLIAEGLRRGYRKQQEADKEASQAEDQAKEE